MYTRILVPISFEEDAKAQAAISVARQLADVGTKITLLHVMEHIPGHVMSYVPPDVLRQARNRIQADLDKLAGTLANACGVVVEGHSSRTILDYAEESEVDCIVIASHRPGMQDLLLGSTAAKVVRHANCAVHVLR